MSMPQEGGVFLATILLENNDNIGFDQMFAYSQNYDSKI